MWRTGRKLEKVLVISRHVSTLDCIPMKEVIMAKGGSGKGGGSKGSSGGKGGGKGGNYPSTTGKPSGGGRGNTPKGK